MVEPGADIQIILVWLGQSMRVSGGELRKKRRSWRSEGCVSWGGTPPIIKLVCCVEGLCLQGSKSFIHSPWAALRQQQQLVRSSLSGCFCIVPSLRRGRHHPPPHSAADWRRAGRAGSESSTYLPLATAHAAIMCDCFHLAFPNWHADSAGPGGHPTLCSLSLHLCCFLWLIGGGGVLCVRVW